MPRVIVQLEIDTAEHPEEVLARLTNAAEVARYSVCQGSAAAKDDWVRDDTDLTRAITTLATGKLHGCEDVTEVKVYPGPHDTLWVGVEARRGTTGQRVGDEGLLHAFHELIGTRAMEAPDENSPAGYISVPAPGSTRD